jgi:hypothetical protein
VASAIGNSEDQAACCRRAALAAAIEIQTWDDIKVIAFTVQVLLWARALKVLRLCKRHT